MIYGDSSFLISLYIPESRTSSAIQALQGITVPFSLNSLHELEFKNGLRAKEFRRELTVQENRRILGLWRQDIKEGRYVLNQPPWHEWRAEAERLSGIHTPKLGTRTYDILHVAAASIQGINKFYTHDQRQGQLARNEGMEVRP